MTLLEIKKYFREELSELYTDSEVSVLSSVFLEKITGFSTRQLRRLLHQEMLADDVGKIKDILAQLKTGKPYQHILGEAEFYGRTFKVSKNVLIPRPETEELVEIAITEIKNSPLFSGRKNFRVLDIGTGSGIIPVTIKCKFPEAEVSAVDISQEALDVARHNAETHQTKIRFIQSDFLEETTNEVWDVIISNPPYIGKEEENEISDGVKKFEPLTALFSPVDDPLIFYRKIAETATRHLSDNGMIFLEINQKFGKETLDLFRQFRFSELIRDLSGNDRFVVVKK
ncbi:peptide chain release factor N(5)-glutamine methyltransferase [Daejeonia sp. YH14]|uniref:peptide chain release factor N(5)-glutamine methyltransferase n=1 Tax=Daejeonia sp. YH14 TaxID=3439042 RepID=UPI003F49441F